MVAHFGQTADCTIEDLGERIHRPRYSFKPQYTILLVHQLHILKITAELELQSLD